MSKKLAVIAFGGNALLRGDQKGTVEEQMGNVRNTCENLLPLLKNDYNVVIGHGNGPQVGNVLLQHEAGSRTFGVPSQPLDICVAETQGSIGYMIESQMRNVLAEENMNHNVITLVTQVEVSKEDAAFENPTKPVGPYYDEQKAEQMAAENGWIFQKDAAGRGMRRVVPSPKPTNITNKEIVKRLAEEGNIMVTVGGGGIPISVNGNAVEGIEAVIDKDLASALLATEIGADEFFILTDVAQVCLNFNTPEEKKLSRISVTEAKKYLAEKHFAEGSMAPKVRAALHFVENGGKECIITTASVLHEEGAGTRIVRDDLI